jgi:nitroimidazol reductase NimA-like FMN-containing flavoprotein (pyridoxamine 5'-phosphate oxidase superfamily)
MSDLQSDRTTLRRHPERGAHDLDTVTAILDAGFVAHVGITTESGPMVIPTAYGRQGRWLYLHGSPASRLLRTLSGGVPVCVTVTLVDGLVLARSTFHHSVNHRSVVVLGTAEVVERIEEKRAALDAFVDHVIPGRTSETRPTTDKELRGTLVLRLAIEEASAKVRSGPPVDDDADLDLPFWAGVLPLSTVAGEPRPSPGRVVMPPPPPSVATYRGPAVTTPTRSVGVTTTVGA